jgi:glycoprotein endo-alpha-1,2-mannosidase
MLQVISWWGPSWREGTHDTQGVNTDAVLGVVIRELEQQDKVKLAFHMEPYEGVHLGTSLVSAPPVLCT